MPNAAARVSKLIASHPFAHARRLGRITCGGRPLPYLAVAICLLVTSAAFAAEAQRCVFPTFGISFVAPPNTQYELTDALTHLGSFVFDSASGAPGARIVLEVAPVGGKSVEDIFSPYAERAHATVDPRPFTIGGEKAMRFSLAVRSGDLPVTYRSTYMTVHDGRLYVLNAFGKANADGSAALDELARTVEFVPVESPRKHLGTRFDKPLTFLGRLRMNGPSCLRRSLNKAEHVHYGIYDYTTRTNPLNVDVTLVHIPDDMPFSALQDMYSTGLQHQLGASEALQWHQHPEVSGLNVSKPITCYRPTPDNGRVEVINRFCILDLGHGDFVQILFTVGEVTGDDSRAYLDLTDSMLATIEIVPASATTTPVR